MIRLVIIVSLVFLSACTEEARNKWSRTVDNFAGLNLRVSWISLDGVVVQSWTVPDGKITSGKTEGGMPSGYYYFWSKEGGYVQLPVQHTLIEEIKQNKELQ